MLEHKIEALLFFKNEPLSIDKLAKILMASKDDINAAISKLQENLSSRGIVLLKNDNEIMLGTAPQFASFIEEIMKEELSRDLGKAGMETLSIILYKAPISRAKIDYIRGVNSSFIIRNLMIRGLVDRVTNEKDERSFLYKPTFKLLQYLGITSIENLPDYNKIKTELDNFENNQAKSDQQV